MTGGSQGKLSKGEVETLLERLRKKASRPECWSCECLQGFLAQLELDAVEEARSLLVELRTFPSDMHPCLGCEPCSPADIFAEYLMQKRSR